MKAAETISHIPPGLLTCLVNGDEVGIVEISPVHIIIRVPEKLEQIREIQMIYYDFKRRSYCSVVPENVSWEVCENEEKQQAEFFLCYEGKVQDTVYQEMFSFVVKQYYDYIVLKSESCDNGFSKLLVGYPSEKDEEFHADYDEWKNEQLQEIKKSDLAEKILLLNVEVAVALENPASYQAYLENRLEQRMDAGILRKTSRFYIGNQFCHNLFPKEAILYQLLEKMQKGRKKITLCFTYLREELREQTAELLERIYQWCKEHECQIEVLVNDMGMFELLRGKEDYLKPGYGVLLNKRRKDPRNSYKRCIQKREEITQEKTITENAVTENMVTENMATEKTITENVVIENILTQNMNHENSLNVDIYREFLKEWGIVRYEYDGGCHRIALATPKKAVQSGISLHLPLYQTNTSQYCTLHAMVTEQDRSQQHFVKECPGYCSSYACMYPKHLHMVGKGNSIFAMDMELLANTEILEEYKKAGMDRVVWNFV